MQGAKQGPSVFSPLAHSPRAPSSPPIVPLLLWKRFDPIPLFIRQCSEGRLAKGEGFPAFALGWHRGWRGTGRSPNDSKNPGPDHLWWVWFLSGRTSHKDQGRHLVSEIHGLAAVLLFPPMVRLGEGCGQEAAARWRQHIPSAGLGSGPGAGALNPASRGSETCVCVTHHHPMSAVPSTSLPAAGALCVFSEPANE